MKLEVGKAYKIKHSRKGSFTAVITKQCDTWTTGVITNGYTNAIMDYNIREQGEEVTFRSEWTQMAGGDLVKRLDLANEQKSDNVLRISA